MHPWSESGIRHAREKIECLLRSCRDDDVVRLTRDDEVDRQASNRAQLSEIVQRVRDGRLRTNIGNVSTLDDAVAAFTPTERRKGKTIILIHR